MSTYRADQLNRIVTSIDNRSQTDDANGTQDENTVQDTFFPISEKVALADTVTVSYFTPATFCWGSGRSVTASAPSDWGERKNVTL